MKKKTLPMKTSATGVSDSDYEPVSAGILACCRAGASRPAERTQSTAKRTRNSRSVGAFWHSIRAAGSAPSTASKDARHYTGTLFRVGLLCATLCAGPAFAEIPYPAEILQQEARLTNALTTAYDGFGGSVDISGNLAVVGVYPRADVFERSSQGEWSLRGSLTAPDQDSFGGHVALDNGTLAVTTIQNSGSDGGPRVYVYEETGVPGLNAWNTEDTSTSSGVYYRYNHPLTTNEQQLAALEGWTLAMRFRMVDGLGGVPSCFVDFTDANEQRFLMFFGLDTEGNLVVSQPNGLGDLTLTTNGLGWAEYHTHQIVFDPSSGTADYYFDGQKMNASPWTTIDGTGLDGVRFGNGSTSGRGSMNWNLVELKTHQINQVLASYDAGNAGNPSVAPDPETVGWDLVPDNTGPNISKGPVSPDVASEWQLQARLAGTDNGFYSLALDGDTFVAGVPFENDGVGVAFIYARQGTNWVQQKELGPSGGVSLDYFGNDVDISGDTVIVGMPHLSTFGTYPGKAIVYVRSGTNWNEQTTLQASDKAAQDAFGTSVAVDGDRAAIGAQWDDHPPANYAGSAYVFERTGTNWIQTGKVFPSGVFHSGDEGFGNSIALSGNALLVGRFYDGAHWLFTQTGTGWREVHMRTYPDTADPAVHDVAMDGNSFIVGVAGTEDESGAAYVYSLDYSNAAGLSDYVSKLLFYQDAANAVIPFDPNQAAFRYKDLLYTEDSGGIRAQYETMLDLYGQPERDLAEEAEAQLQMGLQLNPTDATLGNLLLDIYYCRTEADTILSRELLTEAEVTRFGPPLAPPAGPSGFFIDQEIPIYRELLTTNKFALQGYFSLLSDDLGVSSNPPLGYQIFRDLVPTRALMAATYMVTNGLSMPVTTNTMLFSGYKDLVLLFDLLRDHGRTAHQLGYLLLARDNPGDVDEAKSLIGQTEQFLFLQGNLLKSIFPTLPAAGDPSGLAESIQGWQASLDKLTELQNVIVGNANVLGFAPDFLMLVENFQDPVNPLFDSFDSFKERLSLSSLDSPLRRASDRLGKARTTYDQYKGYEDQIREQYDQSTVSYESRLFEIVGARPGQANYSDNPTNNSGSELDQQYRSIELARLKILRNQTEINNLAAEAQIEITRAMAVSNTVVRYGDMQADVTKKIGHVKAAQAAANALADAFNPAKLFTRGIVVGVLNAAAQAGAEEGLAHLEAQKEQLAAEEQGVVEGINSAAHVKTLLLGMRTLAVDSMEAGLLLQQEISRMAALYREKADLESRIVERNADLASRYFADPIHRLAAQADQVTANLNFADAQRWLFYMVRALEYKWNTPFSNFVYPPGGRTWSANTLFKLRNADELVDFYDAMNAFDALINRGKTYRFDWFSVREDFMGLKLLDDQGQPATYQDPQTGQLLDAISMFRTNLLRKVKAIQGGRQIELEFNTVRQIPGGFFFVGPTFNLDGSVASKGRFLDKIDYLQIRLPGHHTVGGPQLAGQLTYGGTSFIRNFNVGHFDPERPDHLLDELTPYTTRYWFYDPSPDQMRWRFNEGLTIDSVEMQLTEDPRIPPTVQQIEEFKERSVAATGWKLVIPLVQQTVQVLKLDELDDVEIYFHHYSAQRQ